MRKILNLCLVGLAVANASHNPLFDQRICPDGYQYAGDDSPQGLKTLEWKEEIARSPVYSCYKITSLEQYWGASKDSKDVPYQMTFNAAVDTCADDKGRPVALGDLQEVDRLKKLLHKLGYRNVTFLTSAVYFGDIKQWMWLGTNVTLNESLYEISGINDGVGRQCLAANIDLGHYNGTEFSQSDQDEPLFKPVECNNWPIEMAQPVPMLGQPVHQSVMICEVRVETVTYLAWFGANWLAFLLVLMTFLLLTALCLSLFKYKGGRSAYANRRVYRADARTTTTSAPHPQGDPQRDLPYGDDPPTYSDVTGIVTETTQQTKMDKYRNKGKEILAKVTLYKSTPN